MRGQRVLAGSEMLQVYGSVRVSVSAAVWRKRPLPALPKRRQRAAKRAAASATLQGKRGGERKRLGTFAFAKRVCLKAAACNGSLPVRGGSSAAGLRRCVAEKCFCLMAGYTVRPSDSGLIPPSANDYRKINLQATGYLTRSTVLLFCFHFLF
ncbi:hypothetical protein NPIL_92401 [Nephila pilipes]|uniref:Uncharacterized protein n=1 Tax=Nephila pilipes TaxID=299642 RepID=A0A8X6P846_NEPPI|nr:hypothetical protein NPIL_92401 [Nephila pilipes]